VWDRFWRGEVWDWNEILTGEDTIFRLVFKGNGGNGRDVERRGMNAKPANFVKGDQIISRYIVIGLPIASCLICTNPSAFAATIARGLPQSQYIYYFFPPLLETIKYKLE
jgi:hypothetical protein